MFRNPPEHRDSIPRNSIFTFSDSELELGHLDFDPASVPVSDNQLPEPEKKEKITKISSKAVFAALKNANKRSRDRRRKNKSAGTASSSKVDAKKIPMKVMGKTGREEVLQVIANAQGKLESQVESENDGPGAIVLTSSDEEEKKAETNAKLLANEPTSSKIAAEIPALELNTVSKTSTATDDQQKQNKTARNSVASTVASLNARGDLLLKDSGRPDRQIPSAVVGDARSQLDFSMEESPSEPNHAEIEANSNSALNIKPDSDSPESPNPMVTVSQPGDGSADIGRDDKDTERSDSRKTNNKDSQGSMSLGAGSVPDELSPKSEQKDGDAKLSEDDDDFSMDGDLDRNDDDKKTQGGAAKDDDRKTIASKTGTILASMAGILQAELQPKESKSSLAWMKKARAKYNIAPEVELSEKLTAKLERAFLLEFSVKSREEGRKLVNRKVHELKDELLDATKDHLSDAIKSISDLRQWDSVSRAIGKLVRQSQFAGFIEWKELDEKMDSICAPPVTKNSKEDDKKRTANRKQVPKRAEDILGSLASMIELGETYGTILQEDIINHFSRWMLKTIQPIAESWKSIEDCQRWLIDASSHLCNMVIEIKNDEERTYSEYIASKISEVMESADPMGRVRRMKNVLQQLGAHHLYSQILTPLTPHLDSMAEKMAREAVVKVITDCWDCCFNDLLGKSIKERMAHFLKAHQAEKDASTTTTQPDGGKSTNTNSTNATKANPVRQRPIQLSEHLAGILHPLLCHRCSLFFYCKCSKVVCSALGKCGYLVKEWEALVSDFEKIEIIFPKEILVQGLGMLYRQNLRETIYLQEGLKSGFKTLHVTSYTKLVNHIDRKMDPEEGNNVSSNAIQRDDGQPNSKEKKRPAPPKEASGSTPLSQKVTPTTKRFRSDSAPVAGRKPSFNPANAQPTGSRKAADIVAEGLARYRPKVNDLPENVTEAGELKVEQVRVSEEKRDKREKELFGDYVGPNWKRVKSVATMEGAELAKLTALWEKKKEQAEKTVKEDKKKKTQKKQKGPAEEQQKTVNEPLEHLLPKSAVHVCSCIVALTSSPLKLNPKDYMVDAGFGKSYQSLKLLGKTIVEVYGQSEKDKAQVNEYFEMLQTIEDLAESVFSFHVPHKESLVVRLESNEQEDDKSHKQMEAFYNKEIKKYNNFRILRPEWFTGIEDLIAKKRAAELVGRKMVATKDGDDRSARDLSP